MSITTHIRIWIGLAALCLLLSPVLRSGEKMTQFVSDEVQMTTKTFGPRFGAWIVGNADKLFSSPAVAPIVAAAKAGTVTKERQKEIEQGDRSKARPGLGEGAGAMARVADSFFSGFILSCYVMCLRILVVVVWFGMLLPVIAAAVIDGFSQRAVKLYEFGELRPAAFSLMALLIVPAAFGPVLYLTAPVSISPEWVPIIVCVACLPLSLLVANSQPIFGRH